jgi:RHS repeat-associated protein
MGSSIHRFGIMLLMAGIWTADLSAQTVTIGRILAYDAQGNPVRSVGALGDTLAHWYGSNAKPYSQDGLSGNAKGLLLTGIQRVWGNQDVAPNGVRPTSSDDFWLDAVYDAKGLPRRIIGAASDTVRYSYDNRGRLAAVFNGSGVKRSGVRYHLSRSGSDPLDPAKPNHIERTAYADATPVDSFRVNTGWTLSGTVSFQGTSPLHQHPQITIYKGHIQRSYSTTSRYAEVDFLAEASGSQSEPLSFYGLRHCGIVYDPSITSFRSNLGLTSGTPLLGGGVTGSAPAGRWYSLTLWKVGATCVASATDRSTGKRVFHAMSSAFTSSTWQPSVRLSSGVGTIKLTAFTTATRIERSTEFVDGFGQVVQIQQETGPQALISAVEVYSSGQTTKVWNTYASTNDRIYRTAFATEAVSYYAGTSGNTRPYTETIYEQSPLMRPIVERPQGVSDDNQSVRHEYRTLSISAKSYNVHTRTDESGKKTRTYADGWGRTVWSVAGQGHADSARTTFEYDALGQLLVTTSPMGRPTRYRYDILGRKTIEGICSGTFPTACATGGTTSQTIEHTWDDATVGSGVGFAITNAKGRQTKVAFQGGYYLYSYDGDGHIERMYNKLDGLSGKTVAYSYDRLGALSSSSYQPGQSDAFRMDYTYDAAGRLGEVRRNHTWYSVTHANHTWLPSGLMHTELLGNQTNTYTYDIRTRLIRINDPAQTSTRFSAAYVWNPNSTLYRSQFHQTHSPHTDKHYRHTFTYDARNQLRTADYEYGNTPGYSWAQRSDFDIGWIDYDRDGHRVYSSVDQTYTVRGAYGEPIAEYGGTSPALRYWNYVRPDGVVIGRQPLSGNPLYYHRDHLGSTRTVVNSWGSVVETYDYMPFGELMAGRILTSGTGTRPKYTGHAFDDETDLHNMQWRRQIPRYGVFRTVDPHYFYYLNLSPYVYAGNNPLIFIDPDGRDFYWHQETGAVIWVDTDTESIERHGDTYVIIGTAFMTFDGDVLTIHQQELVDGKRTVTSTAFEAVSGLPDRQGNFDYSQENQMVRNRGPVPEGMWQLTGQRYFTTDPTVLPSGGYYDRWGQGFYSKLAPVTAQTHGRSGFEIHPDGGVIGTAGCIGLVCNNPQVSKQFYEAMEKTLVGNPSNRRPMVNVRYRMR